MFETSQNGVFLRHRRTGYFWDSIVIIQQLSCLVSLVESYFYFFAGGSLKMTCCSQIDRFFRHFCLQFGFSLSCTCSCARQRARSARFGDCHSGVKAFSRQLFRQSWIIPGQLSRNKQFAFRKNISSTVSLDSKSKSTWARPKILELSSLQKKHMSWARSKKPWQIERASKICQVAAASCTTPKELADRIRNFRSNTSQNDEEKDILSKEMRRRQDLSNEMRCRQKSFI